MSRKSLPVVSLVAVLSICAAAQTASRIAVTIDASKTQPAISPYLYGQFIEHIGDLVNRSVWAEMIDDRKFYYPINSQPQAPTQPQGGGPARNRRVNRWRPVGPDSAVVMDRDHPYVGDQTPLIKVAGSDPRGIQQAGIVLRKARSYTGRVVL